MNQTVVKALNLLELFTKEKAELSLSDICQQVDIPKPTVHRLLSSLEVCGFLQKVHHSDQDIRYKLGLTLLEYGNIVAEQMEHRKLAYPYMQLLCDQLQEAVHLVIRDEEEAVYVEKVEGNRSVRLYTRVGKRSPLYIGSGPKLLLAYLSQAEQRALMQRMTFKAWTENTITDKETLRQEVKNIQEQGYAVSEGEQDIETIGISYPIRDYTGQVVAALSVSLPLSRLTAETESYIHEQSAITAQQISRELGYIAAGAT